MTENEVAFEGGAAWETELPEIHGRIETEAVAPEKGGVGLFFSLLYTACRSSPENPFLLPPLTDG